MLLVMNPGGSEEQTFALSIGRSTIGRTRDNAVVCVHKSLSRVHAAVEFDGVRIRIVDLDSKNGVFVRGKRVRSADLDEGDTFRCGDVSFLVEAGSDQADEDRRISEAKMSAVAQTLPSPLALEQALSKRPTRIPSPAVVVDDEGRYREKLFVLIRASELLASDLSVDRLLDELVVLGAQVLEVDRLALLTLDEETLEMNPRVLKSFAPANGAPYSQRVVDWVVDHGSPATFADVSKDRTLPPDPRDPRADAEVRAAMAVPIDPGSGTVGVLYGDSITRPDAFRPDDVALLRAIANLAAVGIENAALRKNDRGA